METDDGWNPKLALNKGAIMGYMEKYLLVIC